MKRFISRRTAMLSALPGTLSLKARGRLATDGDLIPNRKMALMPTQNGKMPCGSCEAPVAIYSETTISSKDEPGEALVISGTIYQQNGTTPAEGFVLFLFHTDATGHYNHEDDPNNPRLRGWVRSGKDGHYWFRTIKPARYPQLTNPAHIHAHIYGPDYPERYIDEYWFANDSLIPARESARFANLGAFSPIVWKR